MNIKIKKIKKHNSLSLSDFKFVKKGWHVTTRAWKYTLRRDIDFSEISCDVTGQTTWTIAGVAVIFASHTNECLYFAVVPGRTARLAEIVRVQEVSHITLSTKSEV